MLISSVLSEISIVDKALHYVLSVSAKLLRLKYFSYFGEGVIPNK